MNIQDYKKTVTSLTQDLTRMEDIAKKLEMDNTEKGLHELNDQMKEERFNIAVLGEFNRGKSTLINAMLQKKILPSYIRPTTSCVNRVTYGLEPKALVEFYDGHTEEIDYVDLKDYGTQFGDKSENVREITLWYPTVYCSHNVDIYDTPGLNDTPEMTEATTNVIAKMDAAIFVVSKDANFSMSESEYIGEKLLTSDIHRIIFVITKVGDLSDSDRERLIENTRQRIRELVLPKAEKVLENNAAEIEKFKAMLENIPVYGVDSVMALKARENFDLELLKKSGFPEFEKAVDDVLTRERGRITLERQTNIILKATRDMFDIIQTRVIPLTVGEEEFAEKVDKINKEIESIKQLTEEEMTRLEDGKNIVLKDTQDKWNEFMSELNSIIIEKLDQIKLGRADLKGKKKEIFIQNAINELIPLIQQEFQIYIERIQNFIGEQVGENCQSMDEFVNDVSEHIEEIGKGFSNQKLPLNLSRIVENILTSGILGSAKEGYKIAGFKGAAVSVTTSAATTVVAGGFILAGISIATGIAITAFASPVLISATLAGSALGLFTGKGTVKTIFWKDEARALRKQIADELFKNFNDKIEEYKITENLNDQIREIFDAIKSNVQEQTLGTLLDLQKILTEMNANYDIEKDKSERMMGEYTDILETLSQITDRTLDIRKTYNLD